MVVRALRVGSVVVRIGENVGSSERIVVVGWVEDEVVLECRWCDDGCEWGVNRRGT